MKEQKAKFLNSKNKVCTKFSNKTTLLVAVKSESQFKFKPLTSYWWNLKLYFKNYWWRLKEPSSMQPKVGKVLTALLLINVSRDGSLIYLTMTRSNSILSHYMSLYNVYHVSNKMKMIIWLLNHHRYNKLKINLKTTHKVIIKTFKP